MTDKKDEALKLALEALERYQVKRQDFDRFADEITAIREALAHAPSEREQPAQQEPVAIGWQRRNGTLHRGCPPIGEDDGWTPLYTTPPAAPASQEEIQRLSALVRAQQITIEKLESQRQWVGLTDEDKQIAFDDTQEGGGFWEFADAIEAKLREKNA